MIKVSLAGATGRMGQLILDLIESDKRFELIAATTSFENLKLGTNVNNKITLSDNLEPSLPNSNLIIDFSTKDFFEKHLEKAVDYKIPYLTGITGLSSDQMNVIRQASLKIPILYARNTSYGIAVMQKIVKFMAEAFDEDFDIEISETHHRDKIDAPSGTALSLGESAASGRKAELDNTACYGWAFQKEKRRKGQIGFSIQRGGSIAGEHTVSFIGEEESLSITHKSFSRNVFAKGVLNAALWLWNQPAGLYGMQDIFKVKSL